MYIYTYIKKFNAQVGFKVSICKRNDFMSTE